MAKQRKALEAPSKFNPWVPILLTAPIPLLIGIFFLYKWSAKSDFRRIAQQMLDRQNAVLAMDAMEIAGQVSTILDNAARDVQVLGLIAPTEKNLLQFYLSHVSDVTELDPRDESITVIPLPMYSEVSYFSLEGDEQIRLKHGKRSSALRKGFQCLASEPCDAEIFQQARQLTVGQIYFGRVVRWYTPKDQPESLEGAILPVIGRNERGYYLLGVDYRFIREILMYPTFPYEARRDLLQSYQNGNYIYIVDDHFEFLTHPKTWHVTGMDRKTLRRMEPMKQDEDEGTKPLNIQKYEGERLRDYFERLLKRSFLQKSVDIFQASNLKGTNRVLSVAPILTSRGQYKQSGVYGHVVLGCNVDYFEEPKEKYVPYY